MSIRVTLPKVFMEIMKGQVEIECERNNVSGLIDNLESSYPGIKYRLCDNDGNLRRFMCYFVNGKDIRALQGIETELKDGDEIVILPLIAGG